MNKSEILLELIMSNMEDKKSKKIINFFLIALIGVMVILIILISSIKITFYGINLFLYISNHQKQLLYALIFLIIIPIIIKFHEDGKASKK